MKLNIQKRLAADVLKCSKKRVILDQDYTDEIKEAITKADIRGLISNKIIKKRPIKGVSKARARKIKLQKSKGRQKGPGSRKGKRTARLPKKDAWISKIRSQRRLIKILREKKVIDTETYQKIYLKAKGGFFRSRRHIKLYLNEQGLMKNENKK